MSFKSDLVLLRKMLASALLGFLLVVVNEATDVDVALLEADDVDFDQATQLLQVKSQRLSKPDLSLAASNSSQVPYYYPGYAPTYDGSGAAGQIGPGGGWGSTHAQGAWGQAHTSGGYNQYGAAGSAHASGAWGSSGATGYANAHGNGGSAGITTKYGTAGATGGSSAYGNWGTTGITTADGHSYGTSGGSSAYGQSGTVGLKHPNGDGVSCSFVNSNLGYGCTMTCIVTQGEYAKTVTKVCPVSCMTAKEGEQDDHQCTLHMGQPYLKIYR